MIPYGFSSILRVMLLSSFPLLCIDLQKPCHTFLVHLESIVTGLPSFSVSLSFLLSCYFKYLTLEIQYRLAESLCLKPQILASLSS